MIRKTSPIVECGKICSTFLNESSTFLWYDGKRTEFYRNPKKILVDDLIELSSKLNLIHNNEILSEVDLFKIIHWEKENRSKNTLDEDEIIIQDFSINYKGTGFTSWLNDTYNWIKNEFHKEIVIIASVILPILLLFLLILIVYKKGCKKRKHEPVKELEMDSLKPMIKKRRRVITTPDTDDDASEEASESKDETDQEINQNLPIARKRRKIVMSTFGGVDVTNIRAEADNEGDVESLKEIKIY